MALSIGIVGLPNVGKSTVFNALTRAQHAAAANYPFCTIEPNRAVVPVPDGRLDKLGELTGLTHLIQATIEFVDIAGLVKGASQGEGLGNQFLGHIRDVAAIVHVVRGFDDENVVHISEHPEPRTDIEIINTELILADLQQLERKIEKLTSQVKGDKKAIPLMEMAQKLKDHLERGQMIARYPDPEDEAFLTLSHDMRFLTDKPQIYVANVDEDGLAEDNAYVEETRQVAAEQESQVIKICAQLEADMAGLSDEERLEFLELAGAEIGGLEQVIRTGYGILGLISFFTMNEEQVRCWNLNQGSTAPQAAGVIHTDFERGFIKAEVMPFETFVHYGGWPAAKAAGQLRAEGKEYVVQDGDVIYFRFNV
ncbi:MAG: redox-regulated ATPase YchF [Chloroflexota bacterium]|nr:MAG: redox-regulated ATPase YchF [Chloroflexota bacterium]